MQKALELATQAANGTLNAANRSSVGDQIASIRDALVGLANSKDTRGPAAVRRGGGHRCGDDGQWPLRLFAGQCVRHPIADGQSVDVSVSADRVFQAGANDDTLNVLNTLVTALKSGGDASATVKDAMDKLKAANDNVASVQASVGAREAAGRAAAGAATAASTDGRSCAPASRMSIRSRPLRSCKQTMTVLQATQASFTS